jgi:heptaprenyl diphosphate synthase
MTAPIVKDRGLKGFLEQTRDFLKDEIKKAPSFLQEPLNRIGLKGKGLRASILYICGEGAGLERLLPLAAALELLHLASLVHDDLIDGSELRRGEASFHKSTDGPQAILLGDLLFAQVFGLIAESLSREQAQNLSKVVKTMIYSEILQYRHRFDTSISLRSYRRVIAGKTAGLFSAAASIGGHIAGLDSSEQGLLRRGGYALGMGFQVQDDLLDIWGRTEDLGKPTDQDWQQGQYGYPLIAGLRACPEDLRTALSQQDRSVLCTLLDKHGIKSQAEEEMKAYYRRCEKLWGIVLSEERTKLVHEMLRSLVERDN